MEGRTWNYDVPLREQGSTLPPRAVFQFCCILIERGSSAVLLQRALSLFLGAPHSWTCPASTKSILSESVSSPVFTEKAPLEDNATGSKLDASTMQMKGIAINLYFQLELSSVFLCNSIPQGPLYYNGLKFSSLCNRKIQFTFSFRIWGRLHFLRQTDRITFWMAFDLH